MLCRRSGGGFARTPESGESPGSGCRARRWAWNRSHSHAPDLERFRGKPGALRAGFDRARQRYPHGWLARIPTLQSKGYKHEVTFLRGKKKTPAQLMPRVHRVISLLKRWLIGTHQGAVSQKHLDYYLDEFTFRFNRRRSRSRGKLFFRLAQQAVAVDPVPYDRIVRPTSGKTKGKAQSVAVT